MGNEKNTLILRAIALLIVLTALVACGGTVKEDTGTNAQTVSIRATITDVRPAADGQSVASITIKTGVGKEFDVRLGDQINQTVWGLPHLQGHRQFGDRIGVKYQETPQGSVVVEFSE